MRSKYLVLPALLLAAALAPVQAAEELRVTFSPSDNSKELDRASGPLAALLEKKLGVRVRKQFASDYTAVIEALRAGRVDLALVGPLSVVLAEREARATILAKTADKKLSFYYGAIITHKDSAIKTVKDLRDHTFAFVDPVSTSGYLFPLWLLKQQGVNEKDFSRRVFAGSHEAVILSVLNRRVDAGAVWTNDPQGRSSSISRTLRRPEDQASIRIVAVTPPIPGPAFILRAGVPADRAARIRQALLSLNDTPEGVRAMVPLGFNSLIPGKSADYALVREAARLRKAR